MNLIIIAAIITTCTAGRLEHLEQQQSKYFPPGQDSDNNPTRHFKDSADAHGTSGNGRLGFHALTSNQKNPGVDHTDKEPLASETDTEFIGYVYGPGISGSGSQHSNHKAHNEFGHQTHNQQFGQLQSNDDSGQEAGNQLLTPESPKNQLSQQDKNQEFGQAASQIGNQDATALGTNSIGAQYYPQSSANQYVAPHSSQNAPQQAYDEETGYHY